MTAHRTPGIGPSLLLAAGVIASTIAAILLSHASWLVLVAPTCMAVVLIWASVLIARPQDAHRKALWPALILGASLLLASVIVVVKDPALLAPLMPVLGGGAAGTVATLPMRRPSS